MVYVNMKYLYCTAILSFFALIPFWVGGFLLGALILILQFIACSLIWGFMAKYANIISLGQQIFIGLGGYTTAVLTMYYGFPLWFSVFIAGMVGIIFAYILSFPLLRLRGMYFAIGSLLAAEIVKLFFGGWDFVGGGRGLIFRTVYGLPTTYIYYATLIISVISISLVYFLYYSKLGFGLRSIGCDEDAAEGVGVDAFKCKVYCFMIASFIMSIVGSIEAINHPYLDPAANFGMSWTVSFLFISVIGGLGTIIGVIIGSIIFVFLQYIFSQYMGLSLLLQGFTVLVMFMICREGIWGFCLRKLKLKFKPPI